ncbi:MAG: sigma-70 family RNA polymerase sigma factor [Gemmatimonadales bacterium]|nr:sigma-70 family RNA polymerase sigma factor [Gemmatimonadales bacterium]
MPDSDVTELLAAASKGEPDALDRLLPVVYGKLKMLARSHLRGERADHTLGATALVHEAFLRLVDQRSITWESQSHFYGIATRAMRRILVDHARRRGAVKRSRQQQVTLDTGVQLSNSDPSDEIVAVDEALERLAREDPRSAKLVELRYFGGMTIEESAKMLNVSVATAKRDWALARAWLQRALG